MAADMYLHSGKGLTEEDYECFLSHTLGSKYFDPAAECADQKMSYTCKHWDAMVKSDSFKVGEVSWLKAALFDDDSFIPDPIECLAELVEDHPALTPKLKDDIIKASQMENKTRYNMLIESEQSFTEWLDANMGHVIFQISW